MAVLALIATGAATPALAYWSSSGSWAAAAATGTLAPPTDVTVPAAAAPAVLVDWTAGVGGVIPDGYVVTRHTGETVAPACGSSATTLIDGTSCTDLAVPDGTFTYVVTAVYASWTARSTASGPVKVENATAVEFVDQPTETLEGSPINPALTVALRTAAGNPFPAAGVPVTITIGTNPGGGTLNGTTTAVTDAAGVATFNDLSVSRLGVGYTLTATSPGLAPDTSGPFTILGPLLLGAAQSYSLLAGSAVVNNLATSISGDLGVSPGMSVTGVPITVGGETHLADPTAAAAQAARSAAYSDLNARAPTEEIIADMGGRTLLPGVYHSTAAFAVTGILTLDGGGDPNALFVFQTGAAFNTAEGSRVALTGGARAANVYWVVGGAVTTGANSFLSGTILAEQAITLGDTTELIGRALSNTAITLTNTTIRFTIDEPPIMIIASAATTKEVTPTIFGTSSAPVGSPVTVTIAGQTLTTTVGSGGTWSVTTTTLAAGVHDVVARVRDAAGNGRAASQSLTVEVNPDSVELGAATSFAVLAATTVTNTDATVLNGDLGVSPGTAVTGFPPGQINGEMHLGDPAAEAAQLDLLTAIDELSDRTRHTEIVGNMENRTFHMGVHHADAALALDGTVTLDAEGNSAAIFIFRTDAAFNTGAESKVILNGDAQAANVYWVTGATVTGADSTLPGTILAREAITLGARMVLNGRALSLAAITLDANKINIPEVIPAGRPAMESRFGADISATGDESATGTAEPTEPPAETTPVATSADPSTGSVSGTSAESAPETSPTTTAETSSTSSVPTTPPQETATTLVESTEPDVAPDPSPTTSGTLPNEVPAP